MRNYDTLHPDLKKLVKVSLEVSQVDFVIVEGHRSVERQNELFKAGKSKIDGINKKGKHNYLPSLAFDFCAYVEGRQELAYDRDHIMYLVGVFTAVGEFLYLNNNIEHRIRSGANWDRDGLLIKDQSFNDLVHLELWK